MSRVVSSIVILTLGIGGWSALPHLDAAEPAFLLKPHQRVVFLGDSNTFAGSFIGYLDAFLVTRFPNQRIELLNLGLPSETASGLSEPDHPYPRPSVHERLDRALAKTKPDVVVICYGMNDGIYSPPNEERLKHYQDGIRRVIDKVKQAGAVPVLMTPAPFDGTLVKAKLLPAGAEKYSWMRPFERYDDVLAQYAAWLVTLRKEGYAVADPHTAIRQHLADVRRTEPSYVVSKDGIHPDANGHAIIFRELLDALNASRAAATNTTISVTAEEITTQLSESGKATFRVTLRSGLPMPRDPKWRPELAAAILANPRLASVRLAVLGIASGRYELHEDERKIGTLTSEELSAGVNLSRLPQLSANTRAAQVGTLCQERTRLLGLAWLTDVGHKRPDTPKGVPLADAQRRGEELRQKIDRAISSETVMNLALIRVKD